MSALPALEAKNAEGFGLAPGEPAGRWGVVMSTTHENCRIVGPDGETGIESGDGGDRVIHAVLDALRKLSWDVMRLSTSTHKGRKTRENRAVERYQERVVAYEFYHRLRENDAYAEKGSGIVVQPEVNKSYQAIGKCPDMLFHKPGSETNLAVVEIKMAARTQGAINDDVGKLIYFKRDLLYKHAILLLVGSDDDIRKKRRNLQKPPRKSGRPAESVPIHLICLSTDTKAPDHLIFCAAPSPPGSEK